MDPTAYTAVLLGLGALQEAVDVVSGLQLMFAPLRKSGTVWISYSFAEVMGQITSNEVLRTLYHNCERKLQVGSLGYIGLL